MNAYRQNKRNKMLNNISTLTEAVKKNEIYRKLHGKEDFGKERTNDPASDPKYNLKLKDFVKDNLFDSDSADKHIGQKRYTFAEARGEFEDPLSGLTRTTRRLAERLQTI